jgi:hypothetical protein
MRDRAFEAAFFRLTSMQFAAGKTIIGQYLENIVFYLYQFYLRA